MSDINNNMREEQNERRDLEEDEEIERRYRVKSEIDIEESRGYKGAG